MYSQDLRKKAVEMYQKEKNFREVGRILNLPESTIRSFGLEITKDGNKYEVKRADDGDIYNSIALGGDGLKVTNLNTLVNSRHFKDGEGQEGFLRFKLDEVLPQTIVNGVAVLVITDAYNGEHRSKGFPIDYVSNV